MGHDDVVPRRQRAFAVATLFAVPSGIVVAIGDIASLPLAIVLAAALVFMLSVVVFGVVTYRDARSRGSTIGSALRRSLRIAVKALFALTP